MNNPTQALQTIPEQSLVPSDVTAAALQAALAGDLAKLSGEDRLKFYAKLCEFTGLNPLSKPFDWITFQGKLTLYPNKGCAEQLRVLHGVTFDDAFERRVEFGVMSMTVRGQCKTGRRDFATAAVPFDEKMQADAKCAALMKVETKAKRRMTLSICGLTMFVRDHEDADPDEAPRIEQLIPETSADRAAKINAQLTGGEKAEAIEISGSEAAGGKGNDAADQAGLSPAAATTLAEPVTAPTAPTNANLQHAVAASPTGAAEQQGKPPQVIPGTGPAAGNLPPDLAGPDGLLTDDVCRNIEIVLSERDEKLAVNYLVAKNKLKAGKDLKHLDHQAANFILKKPQRFWQWVADWQKTSK